MRIVWSLIWCLLWITVSVAQAHEPVYCEMTLKGLIDHDHDHLFLHRLTAAQTRRLIDAEAIASLTSTADIKQVYWMPAVGDNTYVVAFAFDKGGCGVGSAFVSVDRFQEIIGAAP